MNEEIRTDGQMITGIICISMGVLLLPLALGCLFSYPDPVWYVGILFLIAVSCLLFGGIAGLVKTKKTAAENKVKLELMREAASAKDSGVIPSQNLVSVNGVTVPDIFVSWKFDKNYWQKFQKREGKFRLRQSILMAVILSALCSWWLHEKEGLSWTFAFVFALAFTAFIVTVQYLLSRKNFDVGNSAEVRVVIDTEKVLINDKLYYFNSSERWIEDVILSDHEGLDIVEFSYAWKTRSGKTGDTLLIPVPPGKKDEALAMVNQIRQLNNIRHDSEWDPRYKWMQNLKK